MPFVELQSGVETALTSKRFKYCYFFFIYVVSSNKYTIYIYKDNLGVHSILKQVKHFTIFLVFLYKQEQKIPVHAIQNVINFTIIFNRLVTVKTCLNVFDVVIASYRRVWYIPFCSEVMENGFAI